VTQEFFLKPENRALDAKALDKPTGSSRQRAKLNPASIGRACANDQI
jgi:hypothetical protein